MSNSASNGLSTFGVAQVVVVILTMTNLIHWPIIWIFAPTWAPASLGVVLYSIAFVWDGLATGIGNRRNISRLYREHLAQKGGA